MQYKPSFYNYFEESLWKSINPDKKYDCVEYFINKRTKKGKIKMKENEKTCILMKIIAVFCKILSSDIEIVKFTNKMNASVYITTTIFAIMGIICAIIDYIRS